MNRQQEPLRTWLSRMLVLSAMVGVLYAWTPRAAIATVFDWDNYSGDSSFDTRINWNPFPLPANVPGAGDTAVFDGQLMNLGIGINAVNVAHGTTIKDMQVVDTAIVDLTIGDGTTSSEFFLLGPLVVGNSFGDTATLNLLGGWLVTLDALVAGRATVNVTGSGAYWVATNVLISGDTITNTAGIGLGLQARIMTQGNLDLGSDTGSGRVVVDGTTMGIGIPSLWTVNGSVDIGPTGTTGFNFGQITLQHGGRMSVAQNVDVHGSEAQSKLTVQSGGDLDVIGLLRIGSYGRLELFDSTSRITTGTFSKTGIGGAFDWTAGTLEITAEIVSLDSIAPHSVLGSSLTVGAGQKLIVSTVGPFNRSLEVALSGTGTLTIENGGDVESYRGGIGNFGTSIGDVIVRDPGSTLAITEHLRVGDDGSSQGQLSILNGASASASFVAIGGFDNAHGTVVVDGLNSNLLSSGNLWVGRQDSAMGTLTIQNQGTVTSVNASIGRLGTPTGVVVVDGVNSKWNNSLDMDVGNNTGGSGKLTVKREGAVTVGGALNVWQTGTVELSNSGVVNAGAVELTGGKLQGSGTLLVSGQLTSAGIVAPGFPAPGLPTGLLNVDGDFVQQAAGTLSIEIGGTSSSQYDRLRIVGGGASLAGTLDVDLINSFHPALGDLFTVLTFVSRSGDFAGYAGLDVGGHLALRPNYTSTSLQLKARPAVDGDINLDGVVDIFDVNKVSSHWNQAGPQGDANGDGIVDIFDVNLISSNWGATGATAVPEPSSALLGIFGALTIALAARARRSRPVRQPSERLDSRRAPSSDATCHIDSKSQ